MDKIKYRKLMELQQKRKKNELLKDREINKRVAYRGIEKVGCKMLYAFKII